MRNSSDLKWCNVSSVVLEHDFFNVRRSASSIDGFCHAQDTFRGNCCDRATEGKIRPNLVNSTALSVGDFVKMFSSSLST